MTSRERVKRAIHFKNPDRVPHFLPDDEENDLIWLWMERPAPIQDWTNYGETNHMTDAWGISYERVAGVWSIQA